MNKHIRTFP